VENVYVVSIGRVTWLDNKPMTIPTTIASSLNASNQLFVDSWHRNVVKDMPTMIYSQCHKRE